MEWFQRWILAYFFLVCGSEKRDYSLGRSHFFRTAHGEYWSSDNQSRSGRPLCPRKKLKQSSFHFWKQIGTSPRHTLVSKSGLLGTIFDHRICLSMFCVFPTYAFTEYLEALATTKRAENKHQYALQKHEYQTRISGSRWGNWFPASLGVCRLSFNDVRHDTWCVVFPSTMWLNLYIDSMSRYFILFHIFLWLRRQRSCVSACAYLESQIFLSSFFKNIGHQLVRQGDGHWNKRPRFWHSHLMRNTSWMVTSPSRKHRDNRSYIMLNASCGLVRDSFNSRAFISNVVSAIATQVGWAHFFGTGERGFVGGAKLYMGHSIAYS